MESDNQTDFTKYVYWYGLYENEHLFWVDHGKSLEDLINLKCKGKFIYGIKAQGAGTHTTSSENTHVLCQYTFYNEKMEECHPEINGFEIYKVYREGFFYSRNVSAVFIDKIGKAKNKSFDSNNPFINEICRHSTAILINQMYAYLKEISKYDSFEEIEKKEEEERRRKNGFRSVKPEPIIKEPVKSSETGLEAIENLIGLESVKKEVKTLINSVKIRKQRIEKGLPVSPPTLHMVFTGNPGTGKTTVARELGRIFHEIGILEKGHFIETDRSKLVEKYVGHTAKKVDEVVSKALGGVLFIDEAYSLANGSTNDFGKEAIDALVPLMENYRDQFILIVAGYTDKMKEFLYLNEGLKSRFYKTIEFEDYSEDELITIFRKMCEKECFILKEEALEKLKVLMNTEKDKDSVAFGNARGVRKIFERICLNQANRLCEKENPGKEDLQIIEPKDIY